MTFPNPKDECRVPGSFVGRERELQQLAQAVEQAGAGHGQVVAIVGEAGVGRSSRQDRESDGVTVPGRQLPIRAASISGACGGNEA